VREALRLGAELEVLEPAALRDAVAAEARQIARLHRRMRRR
jgi:predicted DNA-binding transcriptional regulator YafY